MSSMNPIAAKSCGESAFRDRSRVSGITLIELLVVVGCLVMLLIPVLTIFRQGARSSVQGMLQADVTLEARRALKQIANDLKCGCWEWDDARKAFYTVADILPEATADFPDAAYPFFAFPHPGQAADATVPVLPGAWDTPSHLASRITYRLRETAPGSSAGSRLRRYTLIREERLHPRHPLAGSAGVGGVLTRNLSQRVLFFRISPYTVEDGQGNQREFLWITLKLVDSANEAGLQAVSHGGDKLSGPAPGLMVASFFEVAAPDYLSAYRAMGGPALEQRGQYNRITAFDSKGPP